MHEPITRERLDRYLDSCKRLARLLEEKKKLEQKFGLSGIDYSKTKVTNGNARPLSEEEQNAIRLERKNKEISELKAEVEPEHQIIITQIRRLRKSTWRIIITLKYLEHYNTYDIVNYLYGDDPKWNTQNDIAEVYKKTPEYENYRRSYNDMLEKAIKELESISGVAFEPNRNQIYRQLYIQEV